MKDPEEVATLSEPAKTLDQLLDLMLSEQQQAAA